MIISLIGFMGCGKSSVGRRLSELLCCDFIDLDNEIVAWAGKSIPEIFAEEGEEGFRTIEAERLREILAPRSDQSSMVLSLGGGTVMNPESAELVHGKTISIYLRASIDTLVNNLAEESEGRPMLRTSQGVSLRERIESLMSIRSRTYEETAHIIIDTDGRTIDQISSEIMSLALD